LVGSEFVVVVLVGWVSPRSSAALVAARRLRGNSYPVRGLIRCWVSDLRQSQVDSRPSVGAEISENVTDLWAAWKEHPNTFAKVGIA
jgi:hypothetical protein